MACPTCDHTMKHIGHNRSHFIYWCPRCGTIKDENPHSDDAVRASETPKLVERCRAIEPSIPAGSVFGSDWIRLGIASSINTQHPLT